MHRLLVVVELVRSRRQLETGVHPRSAYAVGGDVGLLAEARTRLDRPAALQARRGRVEREVVAAADGMDIFVVARDGDRERLGPRSLAPRRASSSTTPPAKCCSSGSTGTR